MYSLLDSYSRALFEMLNQASDSLSSKELLILSYLTYERLGFDERLYGI
jgi:hypothetical protein